MADSKSAPSAGERKTIVEEGTELAGEFDADLVHLSGSIKDNTVIRAKSLEVKLASSNGKMQVVFGECILDVGANPAQTAVGANPSAATASAAAEPTAAAPPSERSGSGRSSRRSENGDANGPARGDGGKLSGAV